MVRVPIHIVLMLLLCPFFTMGWAQVIQDRLPDFDTYVAQLQEHPVYQQNLLQQDYAEGELRMSRGGFDPKISSQWGQKEFDDKRYYQLSESELKIPTFLGLSVYSGYSFSDGIFVNPERNLPQNGLWNVGLEANLLQGLFMDERRRDLNQGENQWKIRELELQLRQNQFYFEALQVYFYALLFTELEPVIEKSIDNALAYRSAVVESFLLGDKPAIDTLEAYASWQSRQNLWVENQMAKTNAYQQLENYWVDKNTITLTDTQIPEVKNELRVLGNDSLLVEQWVASHPIVQQLQLEEDNLVWEEKWAREQLKPVLAVKFNPLIGTIDNAWDMNYNINNYKFGIDFSYPIFNRKARGKRDIIQTKRADINYKIVFKQRELQNKLNGLQANLNQLDEQRALLSQMTALYEQLFEAEMEKNNIGESSIFLLNSREQKWLDTQIKQIEYEYKYVVYYLKLLQEANALISTLQLGQ